MTPETKNETEITVKTAEEDTVVRKSATVAKTAAATTRARVTRKVKKGMFDVPETVALALSGAALLGVILSYFFMLLPARENVQKSKTALSQKQTELTNLQEKTAVSSGNASNAAEIVGSVDRFEMTSLAPAATGNAALYQRLNELIRSNGLRNTAGPEYAPLENLAPNKAGRTEARGSGNKQQSIFPGTYVTVTVEGNYGNLRSFISDLEATRQFLVINAVEIESNGSGNSSAGASTGNDRGAASSLPGNPTGLPNNFPVQTQPNKVNPRASNNSLPPAQQQPAPLNPNKRGAVSLRLEMAAYFRRPAAVVQN